jgi:hypothetical protein
MPLLSSDRSSKANIFPATLKTRTVSLKGNPSLTPGFEMQYSLISSMFIAVGYALQYITIDIFKQCPQYGDLSGYCEKFAFAR